MMFVNFFSVVPCFIINMIIIVVIFLNIWNVLWFHRFFLKSFPVKVFEVWVVFNFCTAMYTKTICGLSLETLINKISCFNCITFWYIFLFNLSLFVENCISYFLARSAQVRSFTHDTFVCNNSNGKVINCYSMVLFKHYFRSHISRSSRIF